jgi:hypothetical protein
MRPLFSFRWRSSGSTMGRREAGWRLRRVCLAPLRKEEEDGRLGRGGGGNGRLKREKRAAAGLKGRMGWLAAGLIRPKVRINSFPNNNLIFEYTKGLEICRWRFRRNFDMRIFPKIF